MKIFFNYTNAINGGFGVLSKGIRQGLIDAGHEIVEDNPDICLCYGMPNTLTETRERFPDKKIVYYTVFESSKYPDGWVDVIKKSNPDLVLTASKFNQWVLKRQGVEAKVWHHGLDDRWQYKPRKDDGVFTFIHWNAYEWRKGWEIVLGAFLEEFDVSEPVQLVLKARDRGNGNWLIPQGSDGLVAQNVKEIIGHITDLEMTEMLETADCGVFPVKGEGWFMPSFECVAQGIPVILPKQMAMEEQWGTGYLDCGIDGYINASPRYPGFMIMPSKNGVRKQMRWAYEHQQECRELGEKGSKEVYNKYNWRRIINELESYLSLV